VPLLVEEASTPSMQRAYDADPAVAAWWATPIECASALGRRERGGEIEPEALESSLARLTELQGRWLEIDPSDSLRRAALRLVRVHDVRAADAFQLAAAIVASEERPETLELVTLDERLALAASREGFPILSG